MKNKNFFQSLKCAAKGILTALADERNLRFDVAAALAVGVLAYAGNLERTEWALLLLVIAAVICAELFNTAVEHTVDIKTDKYDKNAEIAKNAAAGATLVTAGCAVLVGILLFADFERLFLIAGNIALLPKLRLIAIAVAVFDIALIFIAPLVIKKFRK